MLFWNKLERGTEYSETTLPFFGAISKKFMPKSISTLGTWDLQVEKTDGNNFLIMKHMLLERQCFGNFKLQVLPFKPCTDQSLLQRKSTSVIFQTKNM